MNVLRIRAWLNFVASDRKLSSSAAAHLQVIRAVVTARVFARAAAVPDDVAVSNRKLFRLCVLDLNVAIAPNHRQNLFATSLFGFFQLYGLPGKQRLVFKTPDRKITSLTAHYFYKIRSGGATSVLPLAGST
jgi:hypothetical protein